MEYKPNSLFAFFKTDTSFHRVEPIKDELVERDILLYDVQVLNLGREMPRVTLPPRGVSRCER